MKFGDITEMINLFFGEHHTDSTDFTVKNMDLTMDLTFWKMGEEMVNKWLKIYREGVLLGPYTQI